jgi:molybdopterin-binding protein
LGESQFQVDDIADPWGSARHLQLLMPISARNKLRGKIEEIELGEITRRSADELKLKKGDTVTAVVKATEVMIQKD